MLLGGLELVLLSAGARLGNDLIGEISARLSKNLVDQGERVLRDLMKGDAAGAAEADATINANPALAQEIRMAVADISGGAIKLPGPRDDADQTGPSSNLERILEAYDVVLYDVVAAAVWAGRPIVLDGFLQSSDWLVACTPRVGTDLGDIKPGTFPEYSDLWDRNTPDGYELSRPLYPVVDFHLRHLPSPQARATELVERNWKAKLTQRAVPASGSADAFDERWHLLLGVLPYWARLEPSGDAILTVDPHGLSDFDAYPEDWQALVGIKDPAAGVARVRSAVRSFVEADDDLMAGIATALAKS